ncbi:NEDD8 ultimate buster 1-like isoform X1 [Varroa jacobsoni]|uniref:UBA domain-containing protein n=1 Tax=Varroa destructor TaxID=109461 RepID=A0A7M7JS04_VARDE|nr:NEDD8 ultimate buster 1-like [Varroa destructor]XP_022709990.1 NEDD8 ultimate buster 1-like isoform X1 [Varroa jacobsoni]
MRFEQESDPRVSQIAKYLRNQNISLWEEPFWHNGETNIAQELVDSIATACHLPAEVILPILVQLQQHALERLEDRKLYSEQKLLTIRVKIGRVEHAVRMPETQSSSKLFDEVADLADTEASRVRLVHQGKMLPNDSTPLCMHNVKQNAKMTALVVSTDVEANLAEEITLNRRKKDVEGTRKTATMAAAIGRCEITNQFGVKINVPEVIRMELTAGLALANKARNAINKNKPHDALAFLLEAETLLNAVQEHAPDLLSSSGNIAQLQLDVVWCFLEIGSLAHLEDAEKRLRLAETGLNDVYGANLEKVLSVKGSATNELTQLTRLQLLKGVAAFYKANYGEAKCFFEKANGYLKRLHVDEDLISQLINLGYTTQEARLALRQANNNIELAMNLLLNKQEQRDKEQRRWEDEQTNKHLQGVNRVLYDRLLSDLGVTAYVARKALLETGNDYRRAEALAIELENDRQAKKRRREETAEEQESSFAPAASSSGGCSVPHPKHVAELIAMGESEESAKYILEFFKGDLDAAQNFLLTGTDSQGSRLNKLISDLRRFVSNETDDYLDSTLEKETECFNTFTLRLAEIESTSKGVQ